MRRGWTILTLLPAIVAILWFGLDPAGSSRATWIELTDRQGGRALAGEVLREGQPLVLEWTNSLFNLHVTERFTARRGHLELNAVTFADPRGLPPPAATAADLDDLYHTGGPFHVEGLARPFSHLLFRLGEIGNPRLHIGNRVIHLLREVKFGGQVELVTRAPRLWGGSGPRETLAFILGL